MSATVDPGRGWAGMARGLVAAPHALAVAAGVLALAALSEALARAAVIHASGQLMLAVALVAVATALPLAFLRPLPAAAAVAVAAVLSLTLFHTLTVAGALAVLAALHRYGRSPAPGAAQAAGASVLSLPFLVLAVAGGRPAATEAGVLTLVLAALAPAAAFGGMAGRARQEAASQSAARQVIAGNLLEHTARGERARIARELHDVVAHHISMVAVQAETARLTTPGMPAAGAQRLSAIGDTARAALTEMRRLLGVLREDARTEDEAAARQPQPGLSQLNHLLDEARAASGTGARLILRGPPVSLDPGVELAAYRIAQEALTNARRHAPGAAVDVELHFTDAALLLRVRDDGPGPALDAALDPGLDAGLDAALADAGGGHGLQGMRERATAVGGRLQTGAAPGGGFLVEATLPARAEGLP
ncbi:MAG TPA: sensor histidine kinase [Actinomycetota bacterium]|nr:sensor histidine kinase [Actinomycetota bacterium]